MTRPDPQNWKKGDPPIDIGWDDEDEDNEKPPRELSPDEQALHLENMIRLRRFMRAYWIVKIGVSALIVAIVIKFFGK